MKEEGGIALSRFYAFIEGIATLMKEGKEVLLVTSGAVGLGVQKLGLDKKPKLLPMKQPALQSDRSADGSLFRSLSRSRYHTAQILLTEEDFPTAPAISICATQSES